MGASRRGVVGPDGPGDGVRSDRCRELPGLGYAAHAMGLAGSDRRLVHDLTLAEHLDEYLEVGTFEFLKELVDSGKFAEAD